jgi:Ca2+-binding RTX toxin-like protein
MPLSLVFTQAGDYTFEDNGTPGDNTSIITQAGSTIFTFLHPADTFTLTQAGGLTVNLVLDFLDTFAAADVTVGTIANPFARLDVRNLVTSGDVSMVATDAIREIQGDKDADITAGTLALSAGTGIGTNGTLEIATGTLEAETTDGVINLVNFGNVVIGGITADVAGLAGGISGNLTLKNYGAIGLADVDGSASVTGSTSGDVTLTAIGIGASVYSNVDHDSISASGGDIKVTAGAHILFGTGGANFDNDVRANGDIIFTAGGSFQVDGFSDIASDDFGNATGGSVKVTAGSGIFVSNNSGSDASLGAGGNAGGDVFLTATGGGVYLTAPSISAVYSSSGDVTVESDTIAIDPASGITSFTGKVTLRPYTEGVTINLGTASDPFMVLSLSDAEIDRISAPTLVIGGPSAGTINVTADITPANATDLIVQSESDINLGIAAIATSGDLTIRAGNNFSAAAGGLLSAGGTLNVLVDYGNTDSGTGGKAIAAAGFTSNVTFTGEADADTLSSGAGNDSLNGMGGNDILNGRGGEDTLDGGTGNDKMAGGTGDDTYIVNATGDTVTDLAAEGTDIVKSSVNWTLGAETENLTLTGGSNISGTGNNNANVITGNSGNNALDGKKGDDTINGGNGTDTITGGKGIDTMTGGGANDTFVYLENGDSSNATPDVITDFHHAGDKINVSAIDAMAGTGGDQAFSFIGTAAFTAEGQIRVVQSGADTLVEFNTSGVGGAEMTILLGTFTATTLGGGDFTL